MAQFSFDAYSEQQAAKRAASGKNEGNRTAFINSFLANDGDTVIVRFPYKSMQDIQFETTHSVTFPGDKWPKRVRCAGDECVLCQQGIKLDTRFFVKAIVYTLDDQGRVTPIPAVWDRAAAFADIDIKSLMEEARDDFGTDLSNLLVKIKRTGAGLNTRYNLSLSPNNNKVVYNPEVYKADFSILESVDPIKIMTKTLDQYMQAVNPTKATPQTTPQNVEPTTKTEAVPQYTNSSVINNTQAPTPASQPSYNQPTEERRPNRYTF